jgi:hypothetical protein
MFTRSAQHTTSPFRNPYCNFVMSALVCRASLCLLSTMNTLCKICRRIAILSVIALTLATPVFSASKLHSVSFGKWTPVQFSADSQVTSSESKSSTLKVRALVIDTRVKEFTFGPAHDITDRLFAVRRAFRVNDSLPQEPASSPHWKWEAGGWLLVDRTSGRVTPINLPDFDSVYSEVNWYRDYAAYCGLSDDGKKIFAVVAQVNRRKSIVTMPLPSAKLAADSPNEQPVNPPCHLPEWQRGPARATFEPTSSSKVTFVIRGHFVERVNDEEEDEQASR